MITGLLFTLAQKPAAMATEKPEEGRHFPPSPSKKVKAPFHVVRLTQVVSLLLTVVGLLLLCMGTTTWSFDPNQGLNIQTAVLCFTLPVGVFL